MISITYEILKKDDRFKNKIMIL